MAVPITSTSHFNQLQSSNTYLVVDFHATWCGPCKAIAPVYEQLAKAETKPGRIAFCKVDVDTLKDVAGKYGVSAMPTFLILKGSSVTETIRGANPTALRTAILSAAASAAKGPAKSGGSGGGFSGQGQTLGSGSGSGASAGAARRPAAGPVIPNFDVAALLSSPASFAQGSGVLASLVRFVGLYLTTLFSLDPGNAAEQSPFALRTGAVGGRKLR